MRRRHLGAVMDYWDGCELLNVVIEQARKSTPERDANEDVLVVICSEDNGNISCAFPGVDLWFPPVSGCEGTLPLSPSHRLRRNCRTLVEFLTCPL